MAKDNLFITEKSYSDKYNVWITRWSLKECLFTGTKAECDEWVETYDKTHELYRLTSYGIKLTGRYGITSVFTCTKTREELETYKENTRRHGDTLKIEKL